MKEFPPSQSSRHLEEPANNEPRNRSLGIAYGNIVFRLLIWRDMRDEILEKRLYGELIGESLSVRNHWKY